MRRTLGQSKMTTAAALLKTMRPKQWTKNLLLFAALIFAKKVTDPAAILQATGAFLLFCALSGAVYLINDAADAEEDRRHPKKMRRPIASVTKMMTALLAKKQLAADASILVSEKAISIDGAKNNSLQAGEIFKADDLMKVMLLISSILHHLSPKIIYESQLHF